MMTSSVVNRVAQMTSKASFFAPCGAIVPLSRCPPSMIKDSMFVVLLFLLVTRLGKITGIDSLELESIKVELNLSIGETGKV